MGGRSRPLAAFRMSAGERWPWLGERYLVGQLRPQPFQEGDGTSTWAHTVGRKGGGERFVGRGWGAGPFRPMAVWSICAAAFPPSTVPFLPLVPAVGYEHG
jgi:hypothetical protein